MERFPLDILDCICSHLPSSDQIAWRLVSKDFQKIANRHFFADLHVFPNDISFSWLEYVAGESGLGRYVRRITFDCAVLPHFRDFRQWFFAADACKYRHDVKKAANFHIRDLSRIEHRQHYARYQGRRFKETEILRRPHDALARLMQSLPRLPNLLSVVMATGNQSIYKQEDFHSRIAEEVLFRPNSGDGQEPPYYPLEYEYFDVQASFFSVCLLALLSAPRMKGKLKGFHGLKLPGAVFLPPRSEEPDLAGQLSTAMRVHAKEMAQSLKHLHLRLPRQDDVFDPEGLSWMRLVKGAVEVGSLALDFGGSYISEFHGACDVTWLLGSGTSFPKLRQLTLSCVTTDQSGLLDFLNAHARTLSSLTLGRMILTGGCWVETFKRMQASLTLQEVTLEDEFLSQDCDWFCYPFGRGRGAPTGERRASMLVGRLERFLRREEGCPLPSRDGGGDVELRWAHVSDASFNFRKGKKPEDDWWLWLLDRPLDALPAYYSWAGAD